MAGKYVQVYIGDYGVNIWVCNDETTQDAITRTVGESISLYGLKIVKQTKP